MLIFIGFLSSLVRIEFNQNLNTFFFGFLFYAIVLCRIFLKIIVTMKIKKHITVFTTVILLMMVPTITRLRETGNVDDLLLKNIECLATPEVPPVDCIGVGTLDCPGYDIKVIFYWQ